MYIALFDKEFLIRDCNKSFVQNLKIEMIKNPCLATTPILCVADIGENCDFKENMKDIYSYITVGGNHSRQAFQEILEEREDLRHNRSFSYRLCAVYSPMKKELVRRLAFQHNRAAAFHHKMTTWDWVSCLCFTTACAPILMPLVCIFL